MVMDAKGNSHKASGRPDGGQFDRKAGQGSDDDLDFGAIDSRVADVMPDLTEEERHRAILAILGREEATPETMVDEDGVTRLPPPPAPPASASATSSCPRARPATSPRPTASCAAATRTSPRCLPAAGCPAPPTNGTRLTAQSRRDGKFDRFRAENTTDKCFGLHGISLRSVSSEARPLSFPSVLQGDLSR